MSIKTNDISESFAESTIIENEKMFTHIEIWDNIIEKIPKKITDNVNKSVNSQCPLSEVIKKLKVIINDIGYIGLKDILNINQGFSWNNYYNSNTILLINEIENIFYPTSFSIYDVDNKDKYYYWRVPTIFKK